jgi:malonate transporter and related proteins
VRDIAADVGVNDGAMRRLLDTRVPLRYFTRKGDQYRLSRRAVQHAGTELDMLNVIVSSIVPVFFVMALGYLAGWVRDIDNHRVAELNALVMDFALPAALFAAMSQTPRAVLLQQSTLIVVLAMSMLAIYGLIFFLQRRLFKLDTPQAAVQSLTVAFPNLASAGLPLISSVFGAVDTAAASISIAVGAIVLSPLTLVLLETGKQTQPEVRQLAGLTRSVAKSILKPVVIAPISGMVLSLGGAHASPLLTNSLSLIGVGAGGIALFLTGLILSSQRFRLNANVAFGTLLKNVVHPLCAAALVAALAAPPLIGREAIILCAIPSGFFGILFGLRYGIVAPDAGSTLIASSLLSAASLPVAILGVSR